MNKKHYIISFVIILTIIGLTITTKVVYDLNKETKIRNEIKEINSAFKTANLDDNHINEILNHRIIKKGHYKEVEDSIKLYYKDVYSDLKNLTFLLDDDNFTNYLTGKNLKEDSPSFIKSKDNLQNSKAQIGEYYQKLTNELTDDNIKLSYTTKYNFDTYYRNLYLELTKIVLDDNFKTNIDNQYNNTINKISTFDEALNFLIANRGHWAIKKEVIMFDETTLYEEYIKITDKLNKKEEKK